MCGIAFCFSTRDDAPRIDERLMTIAAAQRHRGPDGHGTEVFETGRGVVGLGQQRLSILDLTSAGKQPMVSPCGRYMITYNGELYNYRELATELGDDPILDISSGDTAVVLAALARWGSAALSKFNGMWALVFVDRHERKALVARDRMGVKPLYYTQIDDTLVMASEVKGVLAGCLGRRFKVNKNAVGRFLLQSLTSPTLETFFRGVEAFPAASYALLDLDAASPTLTPQRFWWHPYEKDRAVIDVSPDAVRELLFDSVRLRLRSDVPVGVMLSGGLDSSSLLAAARSVSPEADLKVLSVVSRDRSANEEPFIDIMAKHVGCDVIKVQTDDDPQALWDDLDKSVWYYDHPVSSFSNVAHRKIISRARDNGIVVLLTGQGADEQLGGYNKFLYFYLWDSLRRGRPVGPTTMLLGCLINGTVIPEFKFSYAKRYIPFLRERRSADWTGPTLADTTLVPSGLGKSYPEREWRDMTSLSLPDLLDAEDRASMSWSREMRTPFLDYRFVETIARVPVERKLRGGWTKHILRAAMDPVLPASITWRKDKKGYTVPGRAWMTGALASQVREAVEAPMVAEEYGFVESAGIKSLFRDLLDDRSGVRYEDVLSVVALERWFQQFSTFIDGVA